jgi:type IV pilus assembly protein PilB
METEASSSKLYEICLRRHAAKPEALLEAQTEAERTGGRFEKILLDKNLISGTDMVLALAEYLNIPPIELQHFTPDPQLMDLAPRDMLHRHHLLPLCRCGQMLTVAMGDPFDIIGMVSLHDHTGLDIVPVVAPDREIADLLQRFTREPAQHLEDILRDVAESEVEVGTAARDETSLEEMLESAEEAPVIRIVNSVMVEALRKRASDIHIEPMEKNVRLRYRIDGMLYESPSPPKHLQAAIASRIKIMANLNIAERRVPQDGRFKIRALNKEVDVRVSILPTVHGEKIVMRILDKSSLAANLDALQLDAKSLANLRFSLAQPHGMILVTGPTGSGKTTTLYSALQELNQPDVNIITVEDPVEYQLFGINQVQTHAEIGLSFATGLRSILRQDPDIVLIGEIRDGDTASIAVQAALTGHLVLSTLHTNDAAGAIARMVYMGIEPFLLASSLLMTQAQRLYRKLCPACKQAQKMPEELLLTNHIDPEPFRDVTIYQARGCPKCNNTGYKGRAALMEILMVDDHIRELILKNANSSAISAQSVKQGMVTLRDAGLRRVAAGTTTFEEILRSTGGE